MPEPGNPSRGDFLRSQALNRYSYVLNNPIKYRDPSGRAQVCADSDQGGGCGDNDAWYRLTQQWYGIGDQGLLDATILAWLQDHQDIRTIQAMAGYLEAHYGQSGAILPSSFNTIYAHAFAAGELAQLVTNPRAQLLAGAIFAGVGVGGANLGGRKQEMAGRTIVYRVWGTEPNDPDFARQSGPWGSSWTTTDPSTFQITGHMLDCLVAARQER